MDAFGKGDRTKLVWFNNEFSYRKCMERNLIWA